MDAEMVRALSCATCIMIALADTGSSIKNSCTIGTDRSESGVCRLTWIDNQPTSHFRTMTNEYERIQYVSCDTANIFKLLQLGCEQGW